jgi:hypothetical protein
MWDDIYKLLHHESPVGGKKYGKFYDPRTRSYALFMFEGFRVAECDDRKTHLGLFRRCIAVKACMRNVATFAF